MKIHKEYTVDGKLHSKLEVSHGKINGWATTFYPNGKVMTKCKYQEGIPMDEETMYYKSGKIYRIIPFKDGNKHGWL
ncbi:MAG: toxin-antitoxin system YwqK family antitoxin [Marinifilaceae bacterium]